MNLVAVGTKIPMADKKQLEVLAVSKGQSLSKLVRDLIDLGMQSYTVLDQIEQLKAEIKDLKEEITEAKAKDSRKQNQFLAIFEVWLGGISRRLIQDPDDYQAFIQGIKQDVLQRQRGAHDVPQT